MDLKTDENQLLKLKTDIMLDEPIIIDINKEPKNWREKLLMSIGASRSKYRFKVRGARLGTMIKISKLLLDINYKEKPEEGEGQLNWAYDVIFNNAELCAEIIAHAIHNQRSDPPAYLKDLIIDEFNAKQLKHTVLNIIGKMDVFAFTDTITLIRQLTVLKNEEKKVSQPVAGEIIAQEKKSDLISGDQLETLSSIFDSV